MSELDNAAEELRSIYVKYRALHRHLTDARNDVTRLSHEADRAWVEVLRARGNLDKAVLGEREPKFDLGSVHHDAAGDRTT